MTFSDSVLFITGGASGLGEAVARRAVANGARGVAIVDQSADRANALAADLGDAGLALQTDVTNTDQVAAAVDATVAKWGRIDTLVACAGIGSGQRTVDREGRPADLLAYRRVVEVNLIGTFDAVRLVASAMSKNEPDDDGQRGVIVMTSSAAAFDGQIGQVAYSATKGGIVGMTLPLARDLGAVGIRVMTIAPGLIDTPIYDAGAPGLKERLASSPVFPQRFGYADEYAQLVESIVDNPYLNGETIRLDAAIRMPPK